MSELDLVDMVDALEAELAAHRPALDAAVAAHGADPAAVARSLLKDLSAMGTTASSSSAAPGGGGGATLALGAAREAILKSFAFKQVAAAVALCDLSSETGIRNALAAGFNPDCITAVRVLLSTAKQGDANAGWHDALAILDRLRPHRIAYFNYCMRVDKALGVVPLRMEGYAVASETDSALLTCFWQLEHDQIDWIQAPHGLQGHRQRFNGWAAPQVTDPRDYFCVPKLLAELGPFGHRLYVSMGCADTVTSGYTFKTLCEFFERHLETAHRLDSLEAQYAWLQRSSDSFKECLGIAGAILRAAIYSKNPAGETLSAALVPDYVEPIQRCLKAERILTEHADRTAETQHFALGPFKANGTPVRPGQLPLLSQQKARRPGAEELPKREREPKRPRTEGLGGSDGQPPPYAFLSGGLLLVSGLVWNLNRLATHFGIARDSVEWAVVLSKARGDNRLRNCRTPRAEGHEGPLSRCHCINGRPFDFGALTPVYARYPTDAEKRALPESSGKQPGRGPAAKGRGRGDSRGRGKGRGADGGRGRGKGGRGGAMLTLPLLLEVNEDLTALDYEDQGGGQPSGL